MSKLLIIIYFFVSHPGPREHFREFVRVLEEKGYCAMIVERGEDWRKADIIVTDIGDPSIVGLHQEIGQERPHLAYYDNLEAFVPGGYSESVEIVAKEATGVIYANKIGYCPVDKAYKIRAKRGVNQRRTIVYFGGNNRVYFEEAFPAFCKMLEGIDRSKYRIIHQQHPGAKGKGLDECALMERSNMSVEEAMVAADFAIYYQTSLAAQFALAGIPTIQAGHEVYEDVLVRNGLCETAHSAEELKRALENAKVSDESQLLEELGYRSNWPELLEQALLSRLNS